jgi:hypothetical protein
MEPDKWIVRWNGTKTGGRYASAPADQTAMDVAAEESEVLIEGPEGIALPMTPEAADESSDRLYDRTGEARGQRIMRPEARKPQAGR